MGELKQSRVYVLCIFMTSIIAFILQLLNISLPCEQISCTRRAMKFKCMFREKLEAGEQTGIQKVLVTSISMISPHYV